MFNNEHLQEHANFPAMVTQDTSKQVLFSVLVQDPVQVHAKIILLLLSFINYFIYAKYMKNF